MSFSNILKNAQKTAAVSSASVMTSSLEDELATASIEAYSADDEWTLSSQYNTTENLEYGQRYSDDKYSTVDENKNVKLDSSQLVLTQESNSQYIPFVMPRYFDGIDLMRMENGELKIKLIIYYLNSDGAEGWADPINVCYNSTQIKFGWKLTEAATALKGKLSFEIQARGRGPFGNYYMLKTRPNSQLEVLESLKGNGQIIYDETWVTTFLNQIDEKVRLITNSNAVGQVVGDKFSEDINYTTGDFCIYDNTLYVFVADKSASEWDETVVESTTITEELNKHTEEILTITREIADLKYTEIEIISFSNNVNTVEIGSTVNEVTLSWKLSKDAISLYLDDVLQDVTNTSVKLSELELKSNKTWTLRAVDERNALDTRTTSIQFLNGAYWGTSATPNAYDSAFILGLSNKTLTSTRSRTVSVNAGEGQHIYYCVPSRFDTCSFNVGGFDGGFSKVSMFDFTNGSGYTESYDVYESTNAGLGSTNVKVS